MRIVAISDTHGMYRSLDIPEGDVLVHAGDITNRGKIDEVIDFNKWLGELPHKHKVVIAGNHDWAFERESSKARNLLTNATYLQGSDVTIEDLKFWGGPWQPVFYNWAFNVPRDQLHMHWMHIPKDTDVLVTHGPPWEILDLCPDGRRAGDAALARKVRKVKPKLHVFGHIHNGYGIVERKGTLYANASICTEQYKPTNPPHVIDL